MKGRQDLKGRFSLSSLTFTFHWREIDSSDREENPQRVAHFL